MFLENLIQAANDLFAELRLNAIVLLAFILLIGRLIGQQALGAQQPACQQGLHIPSAVGDQVDEDLLPHHPINHPVGLEGGLAVLPNAQRDRLLGVAAAFREPGQAVDHRHQPIQHRVGFGEAIKLREGLVDGLQILLGTCGEQNRVAIDGSRHYADARLARSRATT